MITLHFLTMQRLGETLKQQRQFTLPEVLQSKELLAALTRNALEFLDLKFARNRPDEGDDPHGLTAKLKKAGLYEAYSYVAAPDNGIAYEQQCMLMMLIEEALNGYGQSERHRKPMPPHHVQAAAAEEIERKRNDVMGRCEQAEARCAALEASHAAMQEALLAATGERAEARCAALEASHAAMQEALLAANDALSTLTARLDTLDSDLGSNKAAVVEDGAKKEDDQK